MVIMKGTTQQDTVPTDIDQDQELIPIVHTSITFTTGTN